MADHFWMVLRQIVKLRSQALGARVGHYAAAKNLNKAKWSSQPKAVPIEIMLVYTIGEAKAFGDGVDDDHGMLFGVVAGRKAHLKENSFSTCR